MNRLRLAALIGVIALTSGLLICRFRQHPVAVDILVDQSITVDGSVRRFRLVVPHSLPSDGIPVVFAFHGIGDSAETMAAYSKLDHLAAENGFLLVYPAAVRSTWATVGIDADDLGRNVDLRFFDALLGHLFQRFEIDPDRVYLVGMSNGASFAQLVAFARPSVAAVVAHSGTKPRELSTAQDPFPVLLIVGADDSAADAMRSSVDEYLDNGHAAELISIPGLDHEWSARHNSEMWEFLCKHARHG
jgi:poly(3-hydroxybutyrate) depolymerase